MTTDEFNRLVTRMTECRPITLVVSRLVLALRNFVPEQPGDGRPVENEKILREFVEQCEEADRG